jgi:hypothetical protein
MVWLASKWKWVATGAAVLLVMLVAFLTGKGVTKDDVQAALALRGIQRATKDAKAADEKAAGLKAQADQLSKEYLAEETRKEAEKEKANALAPTAKIIELKRRGILK